MHVACFGDALATSEGALAVTLNDPVTRTYSKLVVSDDATTLLGGISSATPRNTRCCGRWSGGRCPATRSR